MPDHTTAQATGGTFRAVPRQLDNASEQHLVTGAADLARRLRTASAELHRLATAWWDCDGDDAAVSAAYFDEVRSVAICGIELRAPWAWAPEITEWCGDLAHRVAVLPGQFITGADEPTMPADVTQACRVVDEVAHELAVMARSVGHGVPGQGRQLGKGMA